MTPAIVTLLGTPLLATLAIALFGTRERIIERIAMLAGAVELLAALRIAFVERATGIPVLSPPLLAYDALGSLFLLMTAVLGFAALMYSQHYLRREGERRELPPGHLRNYHLLFQLFLFAMFLAVGSNNVLLLWVAVEATTLASAFLINFFDRPAAIEAAWKYMIINTVALLLGLFGVFLWIGAAGSAVAAGGLVQAPMNWAGLSGIASSLDLGLLKLAFVFILVGYGTKAGFAPLHSWLPDAHSQAPVPISAMLSGALLNIALLAILRFKGVVDIAMDGREWTGMIFLAFGAASIVIAALLMLMQKQFKRLLAYSSIEHMGIIAFGFGVGGPAVLAALLHAVYHSLAKSTLFLASGNITLRYHTLEIGGVRGLLRTLPKTAFFFMGGLLAVAAMPFFGTFQTEFVIFALGATRHPALAFIAVAALALAFAGIMRHAIAMLYGDAGDVPAGEPEPSHYVPVALLFILLVALSLYVPRPLLELIGEAGALYF